MVELQNVSKSYGELTALHPLSLVFPAARTTALLGPSGCGKSTILRLIVGLLRPDSGRVLLDEEELTPHNLPKARQRMGYMIQDGGLFPHLTAADNVSLMANWLQWSADRIQNRLEELATLTQLPIELLTRFPVQLSGGQRQRVALMRALFLDPDVLLLDEPMGALDPLIRSELQEELRGIFEKLDKTVILVTHDLGEADFLAHDIVLMKQGRVAQQGQLADMLADPADEYVESFINAQRLIVTESEGTG